MSDKMKSKLKTIKNDIILILATMAITFLFSKCVVGITIVCGVSMMDTYENSDILLTKKFNLNPQRFDVVVFEAEIEDYLIKRVIGLPGETIRISENGDIYINGEILEENYGREVIKNPKDVINEIVIGEDEYFVLGDNRNNSMDSRDSRVGLVKKDKLIGIILFGNKSK